MKYTKLIYRKKSGFSLFEVMVVLAIIAILAALGVPSVLDRLPNQRLKKAASSIYSCMQASRLEAVRSNSERGLCFNIAANTYQVLTDPGPDTAWGTVDDTNAHPGPDGIYGNADDIPERPPVTLSDFGSGIGFGWGGATTNATQGGGPLPGAPVSFGSNIAVFSARGMLNGASGYVYLQNNQNSSYAVGALTSGAIHMRKWFSASANWE